MIQSSHGSYGVGVRFPIVRDVFCSVFSMVVSGMENSTPFAACRQNNCKMLWMLQGTSFSMYRCVLGRREI